VTVSWKTPKLPSLPDGKGGRIAPSVSYYKLRIKDTPHENSSSPFKTDTESANSSEWNIVKQNSFTKEFAKDGTYVVQLEAYDLADELVAESAERTVTLQPRPLLPAPEWAKATPEKIESDGKGNVKFEWEEVSGARGYVMSLISADGEVVSKKQVNRTTASLENMKPGQYRVQVKTLDMYQRPGSDGAPRSVDIRNNGNIPVPKIKALKVK
jgi:hypothetical protein